ncbi:hypothetical protein ACFIOY_19195 [Bradyrhizobium sp. TZ2]
MIIIIDHYYSFVFNIARYFRKLGEAAEVLRNDVVSVSDLVGLKPRAVLISPGPCTPMDIHRRRPRTLRSRPNSRQLPRTPVY